MPLRLAGLILLRIVCISLMVHTQFMECGQDRRQLRKQPPIRQRRPDHGDERLGLGVRNPKPLKSRSLNTKLQGFYVQKRTSAGRFRR